LQSAPPILPHELESANSLPGLAHWASMPAEQRAIGGTDRMNRTPQGYGSMNGSWDVVLPCKFRTAAFVYHNGTRVDLGPGTAYASNSSGQVTGTLTDSFTSTCVTPSNHALLNTSGATADLGAVTGSANSAGYAVNATGQGPSVGLSPVGVSFGAEAVSSSTQPQSILVSNAGAIKSFNGPVASSGNISMTESAAGAGSNTLSWTSSNASSCTASGGGSGNGWVGTKPTKCSHAVSEPFATATPQLRSPSASPAIRRQVDCPERHQSGFSMRVSLPPSPAVHSTSRHSVRYCR
jgi:hypothetical protein